jgi:hypothetical protein
MQQENDKLLTLGMVRASASGVPPAALTLADVVIE